MKTNYLISSQTNNHSELENYRKKDYLHKIQPDRFILNLQRNFGSPKRYPERGHHDDCLLLSQKNGKQELRNGQVRKNENLFTIEENYYTRKKQNLLVQRPPKYKPIGQRLSSLNQFDVPQRSKEKKVLFDDNPIQSESIISRKDSISSKPIIKNSSNASNFQDNLSNSSRSISLSIQNSFTSQFKKVIKNSKPKIDQNRQKYSQIMSYFQKNKDSDIKRAKSQKILSKNIIQQKYTDPLFPPLINSLYLKNRHGNLQIDKYSQIKWKRLLELYKIQDIVLINNSGQNNIKIVIGQNSLASQFMATAFNAVKYCNCIIQKIFQDQQLNQCGLYLLKIWQHSSWKTVLLDDFIPVRQIKTEGASSNYKPAFINIIRQTNKPLQIWPFLLEKAYSNYYSAYQFMRYGNTIDFINQIMGLCPLQITISKKIQKQFFNLKVHLQSVDSFALGFNPLLNKYIIIRATYNLQQSYLVYSQSPTYEQSSLTSAIFSKLQKVYLYSPKIYHSLSISPIGKYSLNNKNTQRSQYSLRRLILTQNSDCLIAIQQKQARFFIKTVLNYEYIWIRMILVQRQFNGYRWIKGIYSNSKEVILGSTLSQGEYYLIIMPEWIKTQPFELTLMAWANHSIAVQKQKSNDCQKMIEEACMDLAQRKGKMKQLSPSLCSYNFICQDTGLLMENINNQKLKEQIEIHREISGIPSSVSLVPINKQFWPVKDKFIQKINIKIPKLSSYTVVLKMKGGMDRNLTKFIRIQKQQSFSPI